MDSATQTFNDISLLAPSLLQANKFGIGVNAAAHLRVTIEPYAAMDAGDLITLFWDGFYVASRVLTITDLGQPVALRVPESFVQSGIVKTWYQVQKVGIAPATSPRTLALVKLDCPGGEPISIHENQGLAPLVLHDLTSHPGLNAKQVKTGAVLTIEPYENMAARDEITLRWGDLRLDLPLINEKEVGKPLTFKVPPAMILDAGDDPLLEISYCIIDLVGNNSGWAPGRALNIPTVPHSTVASILIPKSMFI